MGRLGRQLRSQCEEQYLECKSERDEKMENNSKMVYLLAKPRLFFCYISL